MLKITLNFEFDETQLAEIFETLEIKYSKKTAEKLEKVLKEFHPEFEELIRDSVEEYMCNTIQQDLN